MEDEACPETASRLLASKEKNHTPGTPLRWTYVLTLSSWELLNTGSAGENTGLTPHMVKGVMPTHAAPSKASMVKGSGISGRSVSAGAGQCRNSSLPQVWYMIGHPGGRARIDKRSMSSAGPVFMPLNISR